MTAVLLFKLLIAPLLVAAATLVSRRYGATVGGWMAGFPLTSGPVSVVLALEHGRVFAAEAAEATTAGVVSVIAFALAYALLARRAAPLPSVVIALAAYAAVAAAALQVRMPAAAALALVFIFALAALRMTRRRDAAAPAPRPVPSWDIPARMVVTFILVLILFHAASRFGAHVAGVLSPFPLFASILAAFTHAVAGAEAARTLLRGVIGGGIGFAAFFVVVSLVLAATSWPLTAVYALAAGACLATNVAVLPLVTRS